MERIVQSGSYLFLMLEVYRWEGVDAARAFVRKRRYQGFCVVFLKASSRG
jgi:hypothetical protein